MQDGGLPRRKTRRGSFVLLGNSALKIAVDDRRDLCAGRLCLRHKVAAGAVDQTLADRPVHRLNGVGGELRRVGKAAEIFLERHSRHAAVDCVAVQDRRKLLTGHGVVRAKEAGTVAVDDAVGRRPCDRLGKPHP